MNYVGIDPGSKGGIAVLSQTGAVLALLNLEKATDHDVAAFLREHDDALAVLEKLSPAPPFKSKAAPKPGGEESGFGRGGIANFKIGDSFGVLRGILTATLIPYAIKTPQTWQKSMGCLSGGNKKIPYAAAQRIFPQVRVTLWNADALLIATYCKLNAASLFPQVTTLAGRKGAAS